MIFSYNTKSNDIEICKKTDFTSHNILERQHIEKWIEKSPDILGEDLLIVTNEYNKFDKTNERLDLIALDKEGNVVVIELKRDDSGKNVDLQALKYAAYCSTLTLDELCIIYKNYIDKNGSNFTIESAREKIVGFISSPDFEELNDKPRIILVSKDFRQEVTASVLWLRKFNLDIKCVKLTPYEINPEEIVIEVNTIIPLAEAEDYIIQAERKENQEGKVSVTRQEYLDFYNEIIKKLSHNIHKPLKAPQPRSYYQIDTGISGVHFEWGFHGRPRSSFGVELHFERSDTIYNRSRLRKLEIYQSIIEKDTSEKLIIQENWGQKWARLYIEYPSGNITEDLKNWAVEKMEVLIKVLQPEIDKFK
jgi:hypothetical protein